MAARLFGQGEGADTVFISLRSFLQFDLSSIPQGSFINWARLSLFRESSGGSGSFLLRRVTSAWNEQTVTWNTQPSTALRGTIRLPISSIKGNLKNLNVTNLVQNMVDSPTASFGFALRLDSDARGEGRDVFFISPTFNMPHYNPKLVLEYTPAGMQPAVTTMAIDMSGATVQMAIFPNPSHGAFICNLKSTSTGNMILKVIDILGRMVYTQPVNTSNLQIRVNLPSGSAGTYFVILRDNKGATIVSQQLQVN